VDRYEKELQELLDLKYPDLLTEIMEKKDLSEGITNRLNAILKDFAASFKTGIPA